MTRGVPSLHEELSMVARWQKAFDDAVSVASTGLFETEIQEAKKIFFTRLGASHEMKADIFEAASRSFLEWYLYDYPTRQFMKSPLLTLLTLGSLREESAECLRQSVHHRWSLYRIEKELKGELVLTDLVVGMERHLWFDRDHIESKVWQLERGQIIQARLFPLQRAPHSVAHHYFMTHPWIHPASESALLTALCQKVGKSWAVPQEFLIEAFETVVRSQNIHRQVRTSSQSNWYYQELKKRYA